MRKIAVATVVLVLVVSWAAAWLLPQARDLQLQVERLEQEVSVLQQQVESLQQALDDLQ